MIITYCSEQLEHLLVKDIRSESFMKTFYDENNFFIKNTRYATDFRFQHTWGRLGYVAMQKNT